MSFRHHRCRPHQQHHRFGLLLLAPLSSSSLTSIDRLRQAVVGDQSGNTHSMVYVWHGRGLSSLTWCALASSAVALFGLKVRRGGNAPSHDVVVHGLVCRGVTKRKLTVKKFDVAPPLPPPSKRTEMA